MFGLSLLLLVVCIVGLIRPFAKLTRKHFGWGAAGAFVLMLVTAPPSPPTKSATPGSTASLSSLTPAQAQALEKKNAAEIRELKKRAGSADLDEKVRIYAKLTELAPANSEYASTRNDLQAKVDARTRYQDHPEEALSIGDNWHWTKSGFGSVMLIDRMTIHNDAPFAIKDFVLKCVHQGPSGTDMDSNTRRVYELIPENSSKTIRQVNMGFIDSQVVSSNCEITDAVLA